MSSSITETKCSVCGYQYAYCEHYCRTGEENIFCGRCGSSRFIDLVKPENEGIKPEYKVSEEINDHHYNVVQVGGLIQCGGFKTPHVEKWKEDMIKLYEEKKELIGAIMYTFKDKTGKWFVKNILNNEVKPFTSEFEVVDEVVDHV